MSRSIILVLPLIILFLGVLHSGDARRSEGPISPRVSQDQERNFEGLREGREASGSDSSRVKNLDTLVELLALDEHGRRSTEAEAASQILTEMIWEKIDPALRVDLDQIEESQLRTYLSGLISPSAKEQPWLCWAPGVSEKKIAVYHEVERLTGLSRNGYALFANQFLNGGRWRRTATDGLAYGSQGDASIVTWSIVPDGTATPGLMDQATTGSNLRAWMASIYGGATTGPAAEQPWFGIFEEAIASMAGSCGITLVYEPNDDGAELASTTTGVLGIRGDIRLSARMLDGDSGNLGVAFGPDHGDIIFDSSDGTFDNTGGSSIRLSNTIAHELGHSLGLAHVCPLDRTKLLEPVLTTSFRGPQFDEYQSLQRLYGDAMEVHGSFRENDTFSQATPLELSLQETRSFPRLSIDDNRDIDFYRFDALAGESLRVEVIPGESSYLEGGQLGAACSQGEDFDSARVNDLFLELLSQDGRLVLASSDSGGAGTVEKIDLFEFPEDGEYFIKIRGGPVNRAQLYDLRLELRERPPGPRLVLGEWTILGESGSVKNGQFDPNETIRIQAELENQGELATGELSANLTGSANVRIFAQSLPGSLAAGSTGMVEIVWGAAGDCGDFADLGISIGDESGVLLEREQTFELGNLVTTVVFDEGFEASTDLPWNWSSVESGSGRAWDSVSTDASSGIRSAFSPGRVSVGEASLLSPSFVLAQDGGTLSFEHRYDLERGFDGGVLEVSRDGGEWHDLLEHPAVTLVTGGYTRTIRDGFDSAISGQRAWSDQINSFVPTTVGIPASWAGETIRFRWRLVHDRSDSDDGWWIDNIMMQMVVKNCEPHRPEVSLISDGGDLDEHFPTRPVILRMESEFPLVNPITIPLIVSGSATAADFQGDLLVTLPAGLTSVEVPFLVSQDEEEEGMEILTLSLADGFAEFVPGNRSSVSLGISDRSNLDDWSRLFFGGPVNLLTDADGDGFSALAEYLLGTDPTVMASRRSLTLRRSGGRFLIPLPFLPERADAALGVEASGDLIEWTSASFEVSDDGILVNSPEGEVFFRLTFSLDQ